MNPDTLLAEAIVAVLKAAPAVTVLVNDRVHAVAPRVATYPCVAVTRLESRPTGGLDGEGLEHVVTLTCVSKFGGPEEARALVAAVRAALHDARPTITGRRVVNLRVAYADVFRAADGELTFGLLRLRAVTEPL